MGPRSRHQASRPKLPIVAWVLFALGCREPRPFGAAAEEPFGMGSGGETAVSGFGGGAAGKRTTHAGGERGDDGGTGPQGGTLPDGSGGAGAGSGGTSRGDGAGRGAGGEAGA